MVNLKESMNLAGQNLIHMLSPDNNYLPNFWIFVETTIRRKSVFSGPVIISAAGGMLYYVWKMLLASRFLAMSKQPCCRT